MPPRAHVFAVLACLLLPSVASAESARAVAAGSLHSCAVTTAGGVECWGENGSGQLGDGTTTDRSSPVAVSGLPAAVAVGTGDGSTCALTVYGSVECWGNNDYGQLGDNSTASRGTPALVEGIGTGAMALSVGAIHACALMTSGIVRCWGYNGDGQIGNNTTTNQATAVNVTGLSGVQAVSAGVHHTCAVLTSGQARCWGSNGSGRLGDGTTTIRLTPVAVSGLTNAQTIGAGSTHSCALTTSGAIVCWGNNDYGQIGDGTTTDRWTPVAVTGLTSRVAALHVGAFYNSVVLGTGAVKCWGSNSWGQLGDGTTIDRTSPVDVSGLASGVAFVSGGFHTCALTAAGAIQCWGRNTSGELGDGSTTNRSTPGDVTGFAGGGGAAWPAGAVQVASGTYHTCAVTRGGGVVCWGENADGELGDGTTIDRTTPVPVLGVASGVAAVAAGGSHTCALTTAGGLKCWGSNNAGQLGDGTLINRLSPVSVPGLTSGVAAVSLGFGHTCARTTGGAVKCWGANAHGQLGVGHTTQSATPLSVAGLASGVSAVTAGGYHTCALSTAGGLRCWGLNGQGQLGDGTTTDRTTPSWVNGLSAGVSGASAGLAHTCAVTSAGAARCWGFNGHGELGDGTTTNRPTAVDVTNLSSGVSELRTGAFHACALTSGGAVECWGDNSTGELGDGTTTNRSTPVQANGLNAGIPALGPLGNGRSCVLTARAGVLCWGGNAHGELGDGTTAARSTPGWVLGFVAGVGAVEAGQRSSCRMTATGGVQCWGDNQYGQLGDGTTNDRRTPVDVLGLASGVASIAVGNFYACALTTAGGVKCWGRNSTGQLGDGTTTNRLSPVDVSGRTSDTVAISCGLSTTCAVTTSGGVQCWGVNTSGQVGDGTATTRLTPVWVESLTAGAVSVAVGYRHACAGTAMGGVRCWGANTYGQLGDGAFTTRTAPSWTLATGVSTITTASAANFTCALQSGTALCWGENTNGQLGNNSTTSSAEPTNVWGLFTGGVAFAVGGDHACVLTVTGRVQCWGDNSQGQLGNGTITDSHTPVNVSALTEVAGTLAADGLHTCATTLRGGIRCWGDNAYGQLGDGTLNDRLAPMAVRGFGLTDDYDADVKADIAVYRPSAGTWFSLNSSTGNASYQYRGWGVQAQGDTAVAGDFDGDGIVDPTVFRPGTGTWFILLSAAGFTTWDYFGWGSTGDTLVPADYDGDGITDAAVYRPSTGTWYVRPSSGATQWNVTFGNATDVPIPGHYDADGKADIAVYRPSTGTWFILTSSSGWASYWYKGWGVNAQGDAPAPGDYDGDGRLDLCVFRPSTGTWFILESQANYTTWNWIGWGASGDTLVPSDFDGDGITDAAVYRASNHTWYIRPSSGATQWSIAFGTAGDVPLITIR